MAKEHVDVKRAWYHGLPISCSFVYRWLPSLWPIFAIKLPGMLAAHVRRYHLRHLVVDLAVQCLSLFHVGNSVGIAVCATGELFLLGVTTLSSRIAPSPIHTPPPPGSQKHHLSSSRKSAHNSSGGGANSPRLCAVLGSLLFLALSVLASLAFIGWGYGVQYALLYSTLEPYQFQSYLNVAASGAPASLIAILNQYQVINGNNVVNVVKYALLVSMGCLFLALVTVRLLTRANDMENNEIERRRSEKIHVEDGSSSLSPSSNKSTTTTNNNKNNGSTGATTAQGQGLSVHTFFFILRSLPLAVYLFSVGVLVLLLLRLLFQWGPIKPLNPGAFDDYNEEAQGGVGQRDDALPWGFQAPFPRPNV